MKEREWKRFHDQLIYCKNCNVTSSRITPYCAWCGSRMKNYFRPEKCECYHVEYGKSVCWGTKEREVCNCEGIKRNCNFYEEVRRSGE